MTAKGKMNEMKGIGQYIYELTPVRYHGQSYWILANGFQEASEKALVIVKRIKDRIGSLEFMGSIDA